MNKNRFPNVRQFVVRIITYTPTRDGRRRIRSTRSRHYRNRVVRNTQGGLHDGGKIMGFVPTERRRPYLFNFLLTVSRRYFGKGLYEQIS